MAAPSSERCAVPRFSLTNFVPTPNRPEGAQTSGCGRCRVLEIRSRGARCATLSWRAIGHVQCLPQSVERASAGQVDERARQEVSAHSRSIGSPSILVTSGFQKCIVDQRSRNHTLNSASQRKSKRQPARFARHPSIWQGSCFVDWQRWSRLTPSSRRRCNCRLTRHAEMMLPWSTASPLSDLGTHCPYCALQCGMNLVPRSTD